MNIWVIFLTGLFAGGLTCMAVQGGFLAATLAQREEEYLQQKAKTENALPILTFLLSKLVAYTALGLLLGWFGSIFSLSIFTQAVLQFIVAIFMIGTALDLLHVHPIFRYFIIQPPIFIRRFIRKESKSADIFAPSLLGALTVFIPCGTTQAMMALAIASANPFSGALILFAFILGTSPIFFLLGYFMTRLGGVSQKQFMKVASCAIMLLALFNLNNAIALTGSNLTLENIGQGVFCTVSFCANDFPNPETAVTTANISILPSGYNPNNLVVKKGEKITIRLKNNGGGGCTQAFTIPRLGIQKIVPIGSSGIVQFTAPSNPTQIGFMCSQGNYRGTINVI